MKKINILNTRDVKKIREKCIEAFGYFLKKDYAYLKTEKEKIFVINKDISKIDLEKLRIDKIGLYFAEDKDNYFRLSKEGTQLLVGEAKKEKAAVKNIVYLNKEEVEQYFKGKDLEKDLGKENCLIILSYKESVLGCARYKERKILNFLPKINRGIVIA